MNVRKDDQSLINNDHIETDITKCFRIEDKMKRLTLTRVAMIIKLID